MTSVWRASESACHGEQLRSKMRNKLLRAVLKRYPDRNGEYRSRVVASNGKRLFTSSEGYRRRADMLHAERLTLSALLKAHSGGSSLRRLVIDVARRNNDVRIRPTRLRRRPRLAQKE